MECMGACVNAPMIAVDDDYYEDLDYESTVKLIEALKRGERPRPAARGPAVERARRRRDVAHRSGAGLTMALSDKDRIFTQPLRLPGLEPAGRAHARLNWDGTAAILAKGRDAIIEEVKNPACAAAAARASRPA
jgi:hypothetical protein